MTPKLSKQDIINELWRRGDLSYKLHEGQKELYELFYNSKEKTNTWLLGRRCLAEGTLIKTPTGLKAIEDFKPGDQVYGVNPDGTVTPTTVKEVFNNGIKEVVDLVNHNRVLETCTLDHVWLSEYENPDYRKLKERKTSELTRRHRIIRKWVDVPGGSVVEPHAYAIGALLGDGCSRQGINQVHISSETDEIPKRIAKILKCDYKPNANNKNYTWILYHKNRKPVRVNRYKNWCKGRYAHQKTADLNKIKSWCRSSQLSFLAGLIDTDGAVNNNNGILTIQLGMQALDVIKAAQYIIHNNFQYKPEIHCDNRQKYKNGPVWCISIRNNLISKKISRAISPYQALKRKKWKKEYEHLLENNTYEHSVGVKKQNSRLMPTWDLSINNDTNLYLTANGLVTHNSGKSFTLVVLAIETCLRNPNCVVKLVSPTLKQLEDNIIPLFNKVLEDCPSFCEPNYTVKNGTYTFKNKSKIQLGGSDGGNAEKFRGSDCKIAFVDEAGTCDKLSNLVKDILLPATLATKGKVILASTPPGDGEHDFYKFIEAAEKKGTLVKKPTHSNPIIPPEELASLIEELGGENSDVTRREIYCEAIRDAKDTVFPEFDERVYPFIVKDVERPPYFDSYVGMDLGFKDLTAVVFGYYDFKNATVVIEDELLFNFQTEKNSIPLLVKEIQNKEKTLWYSTLTNELKPNIYRVSDLNPIVTKEISSASNGQLSFGKPRKDDKEAAVNQLRMLITGRKLVISPKCKNLILQLKHCKWKITGSNNKREFTRSDTHAHYDLCDAVLYFVRSINYSKNPYPEHYNMNPKDLFIVNDKPSHPYSGQIPDRTQEIFRSIFKPRKPHGF